jgi:hypothetical protein
MSDTDYINDHMGGFGDVDYAFYHSDERGLDKILYAITMTLEAVKLLPYTINDKTHWKEKIEPRFQHPELVGIADGWSDIYDVFKTASDTLIEATRDNRAKDYFIFIHPEKGILEVTFIGKQESRDESTSVELYMEPDPEVDADKWRFGLISALSEFNTILKDGYDNYSVERFTKEEFYDFLSHKITIRDIRLELENLYLFKDEIATKGKIVELVTEMARFHEPSHIPVNMDRIKILVEVSTKDNLMPIFEIEPSDGVVFHLYEVSLKGDIISLHWMRNETLKEKYSLVDGTYSVPLLDLIKSRKLSSIYG